MKKFSLFMTALAALIFSCPAFAQSVPLQAGPWTSGHQPMYSLSGGSQPVVQDGGGAGGGAAGTNPSELGLTIRGTGTAPYANQGNGPLNTNLCDYDAPTNNSGGFHYLCISPNAQGGGLLAYGSEGGASNLPLYFLINGVKYEFPAALSGVAGPSSSVVGDLACWNNTAGTLLDDCGTSIFSGPSSSTDSDIATFDGTTGNKVKDSGVSLGSQAQNLVLATPSVASGNPSFRALVGGDLPSPTLSAKGGVKSSSAPTNEFATGVDTSGNITYAQPTVSGIDGLAPIAITGSSADASFTQDGTGAVSESMQTKGRQLIWIKDFGAICNGIADDTTAIQNAWNEAQKEQKNVWLSGVGPVCKIHSLSMPFPGSGNGGQSVLMGDGPQSVTLESDVTGTDCAICVNATYGSTGSLLGVMGGFTLESSNASGSNAGYGIDLTGVTSFTLSNFSIVGNFDIGIAGVDTIWLNIDHCEIYDANEAIYGDRISSSNPNNWNIGPACLFHDNIQMPIYLQNPGDINIFGDDFEHNGIGSTGNLYGALMVDGNPVAGTKGVSFYGNYVENNFGAADVIFRSDSGQSYSGAHEVYGNTFNRLTSTNVTDNVLIDNLASSGITSVSIHDNGFNEEFTPTTGNNIDVTNPISYGTYQLGCNGNVVAHASVEMTKVACQPKKTTSPGWILTDGMYQEFGSVTATPTGAAVTFPMACPNGVVSVSLTGNNGSTTASFSTGSISNTGFTAYSSVTSGASYTALCH